MKCVIFNHWMATNYLYKTDQFGISSFEIHLLRSEYPFRKIPLDQIQRVDIKKGLSFKHPLRTLVFATVLIAIPIFLFLNYFGIVFIDDRHFAKMYSGLVFGSIALFAFGIYILGLLLIPSTIMKIQMLDGSNEVLDLRSLKKKGELVAFVDFLKSNMTSTMLFIQSRLDKPQMKVRN